MRCMCSHVCFQTIPPAVSMDWIRNTEWTQVQNSSKSTWCLAITPKGKRGWSSLLRLNTRARPHELNSYTAFWNPESCTQTSYINLKLRTLHIHRYIHVHHTHIHIYLTITHMHIYVMVYMYVYIHIRYTHAEAYTTHMHIHHMSIQECLTRTHTYNVYIFQIQLINAD